MKMSDLKYEDGFPANISMNNLVVVQIQSGETQGVVLYTCKLTGDQARCYLPLKLNDIYTENLYIIQP